MSEPKYPAARVFAGRLEAHFAGHAARGRAAARRERHRGADRRRLLGQPAARGGLRAGDLARLPAPGASRAAAAAVAAAAARPAGARPARAGGRAPGHPPGRVSAGGRARGVGHHARGARELLRARGGGAGAAGGEAPPARRLGEVSQRGRVRGRARQGPEPRGEGRGRLSGAPRSAARPRVLRRHRRARRRAAAAGRLDARAQARGNAARGSRGDRGLARVDRAADRLLGRSALHGARRSHGRRGRAAAIRRTPSPSGGWWTRSPASRRSTAPRSSPIATSSWPSA